MMLFRKFITEHPSYHKYIWSIVIFGIAFLPRLFSPITRPIQWEARAFLFREALLTQDWANTYQQYHPGVTLMWLVAIGLQFFIMRYGPITEEMWLLETASPPGLMETGVEYAVVPVTLTISFCILIIYWLLVKLIGQRQAIVAALLLALDPYLLTYSRVVHVDGLLAIFMFLSGLSLIVYTRTTQRRYLLISGAVAGLAFLTKTPSVFLIAYTGLILLVWRSHQLGQDNRWLEWRALARVAGNILRDLLLWGTVAVLLFFVFWPAMWVNADEIVSTMWSNLLRHASNPHHNPIYFLGETKVGDPGSLYYGSVIAWNTTFLSLPAVFVGAGLAVRHSRQQQGRIALAILAYAFFFFAQMSIGEFKQLAYILPIFPPLDILAAIGLVTIVDKAGNRIGRQKRGWTTAVLSLLIGAQALLVLSFHPYYGNHYNKLLGGARVARDIFPIQDQGEGLDLAADYLNRLPFKQNVTVATFRRNGRTFKRAYHGRTTYYNAAEADFRVYDVHSLQRNLHDLVGSWTNIRDEDMMQDPLFTVDFNGIPYVSVYGDPDTLISDGVTLTPASRFGDHITLRSTIISNDIVGPGETLTIIHYWQSDGKETNNYKVFNHLLNDENRPVAQRDELPLDGKWPMNTWMAHETMKDIYQIKIPTDIEPGAYRLGVGFYEPDTFTRLPAFAADGDRLANDTVIVTTITIGESATKP